MRGLLWALMGPILISCVFAVSPGDITTCTNTNSSQVPHINNVKSCSSVAIFSDSAKGFSYAYGSSKGASLVSAAGACGDAVASGLGAICKGLDPGAHITTAAQICANALAAVYSRTASGAASAGSAKELLDPLSLAKLRPTKQGFYSACASSCNNAQSAAEALAQGAACGANKAVGDCTSVIAEVKSETFARAFVSVAADGWSKACAKGSSAALTSTTSMAASAAASFASAIARVAAKACSSCPSCKCSPLPAVGGGLNTAGKWADTFATFAGGKVGVARALAGASSALCAANGTATAKSEASGVMAAVADMMAAAVGTTKARAIEFGSGASACSGATLKTQLEAMKQASAQVTADVSSNVYGGWCPTAAAKLRQVELLSKDSIDTAANRTAQACTGKAAGGLKQLLPLFGKRVAQDRIITQVLLSNVPLKSKITDVLNEAKKCGCPPSLCLWCADAETLGPTP